MGYGGQALSVPKNAVAPDPTLGQTSSGQPPQAIPIEARYPWEPGAHYTVGAPVSYDQVYFA